VNWEPALALAGPRALLMQAAHPLAVPCCSRTAAGTSQAIY
jgi:hypothetical protein